MKLVVLGAVESGVGAAILGKDLGYDVWLSDSGMPPQKYTSIIEREQIPHEYGTHTLERMLDADLVVKSPGIPSTAPVVVALRNAGIEVVSEIEFAGRHTHSKMVCITGSNGKTTTTLLTYHILRSAGLDVGLAGNVGKSLALQVARDPHDLYVIELSSFQLDDMYTFKANIAVLLNITPDHLDRYDYKMENYVKAKFRILQNQTPTDAFIYWQDDPVIQAQLAQIKVEAHAYPFGVQRHPDTAAWLEGEGEELVFDTPATELEMPRSMLSLNGLHNLYNSMAAGLSACLLNIDKEHIMRSLSDFEGVEHRLEFAGEVDGVRYINDSKATNVNSCYYALESMPDGGKVVLILGGKDKGNDYTEILPLVRRKVKAIVAMGLHNEKIVEFFSPYIAEIADTHTLEDAMEACRRLACERDTVLLSPCCASFDLFTSYENRGDLFKAAVKKMK